MLLGRALLHLNYLPGSLVFLDVIRGTTQNFGRVSGAEARILSNVVNASILLVLSAYIYSAFYTCLIPRLVICNVSCYDNA